MWKRVKIEYKARGILDINYYIAEKLTKWTCHNKNGWMNEREKKNGIRAVAV